MDFDKLRDIGKPKDETEREKINRLTEEVSFQLSKKYQSEKIFDAIEKAVIKIINLYGYFKCSKIGIGEKLFGFEDHENPVQGLYIGVMPSIDSGCLNIFTSKLSNVIYENGSKDLIIDILIQFIVNEMKKRFAESIDYIYTGTVENKNEGIITKEKHVQ